MFFNLGKLFTYKESRNRLVKYAGYPIGFALFALLLAIYKSLSLTTEMGGGVNRFLTLAGLDVFFVALLLLLCILHARVVTRSLQFISWLLLALMSLYYLVDSFTVLALDEHASLFEIGRYAPEWGVVLSFFDIRAFGAIVLLAAAGFLRIRQTTRTRLIMLLVLVIMLLVAVLSAVSAPQALRKYAVLSPLDILDVMTTQGLSEVYSEEDVQFFTGLKHSAAIIPETRPNVILLVVESLSSINSAKVSGSGGWLNDFDVLAEQGVLFSNFFANHQASEGGLIALLGGFPPIHFPTATPYMFDEFAVQPSVIGEYQQAGYFTEFLTNADLAFIGLDRFLSGLGVDHSRGRDEVDTMKNAPRVVQDAPSDAYLYQEAILTVERLQAAAQPFVLTVATTSTHLPYTHPGDGSDTAEAVWAWSMQQLRAFHTQIADAGFFENGILLVTGDHRQMRPVSEREVKRYGDSAKARVPLLVIGKDLPAGEIDTRFFQQSDLLRLLGKIDEPHASLSPYPVWVERYNRKYGRIELIDKLGVFDEADGGRHEYRIRVPGNRIEWLERKPAFARKLETQIHMQRSLHQVVRNKRSVTRQD